MTEKKTQKQLRIEREAKALQKNLDKRKKQKQELEKLKDKKKDQLYD